MEHWQPSTKIGGLACVVCVCVCVCVCWGGGGGGGGNSVDNEVD